MERDQVRERRLDLLRQDWRLYLRNLLADLFLVLLESFKVPGEELPRETELQLVLLPGFWRLRPVSGRLHEFLIVPIVSDAGTDEHSRFLVSIHDVDVILASEGLRVYLPSHRDGPRDHEAHSLKAVLLPCTGQEANDLHPCRNIFLLPLALELRVEAFDLLDALLLLAVRHAEPEPVDLLQLRVHPHSHTAHRLISSNGDRLIRQLLVRLRLPASQDGGLKYLVASVKHQAQAMQGSFILLVLDAVQSVLVQHPQPWQLYKRLPEREVSFPVALLAAKAQSVALRPPPLEETAQIDPVHLGERCRLSAQHQHQRLDFILVPEVGEHPGHDGSVA